MMIDVEKMLELIRERGGLVLVLGDGNEKEDGYLDYPVIQDPGGKKYRWLAWGGDTKRAIEYFVLDMDFDEAINKETVTVYMDAKCDNEDPSGTVLTMTYEEFVSRINVLTLSKQYLILSLSSPCGWAHPQVTTDGLSHHGTVSVELN